MEHVKYASFTAMLDCGSIDTVVATAAFQQMLKHSWYLDEKTYSRVLVVYVLFVENLVDGEEAAVARKFLYIASPSEFRRDPSTVSKNIDCKHY